MLKEKLDLKSLGEELRPMKEREEIGKLSEKRGKKREMKVEHEK